MLPIETSYAIVTISIVLKYYPLSWLWEGPNNPWCCNQKNALIPGTNRYKKREAQSQLAAQESAMASQTVSSCKSRNTKGKKRINQEAIRRQSSEDTHHDKQRGGPAKRPNRNSLTGNKKTGPLKAPRISAPNRTYNDDKKNNKHHE